MTYRTVKMSSYETYLAATDETRIELDEQIAARTPRLLQFPRTVMLELSYPERDFANRWCFQQLGPNHGECFETWSAYPVCSIETPHCHPGTWTNHWFVKTDYDFGFNEWCFSNPSDHEQFLAFVPLINWGERFPIKH